MTSRSADHKERQLVAYLVDRLMQNSFDERELYSLYILLREYAPNGSPVRELSDFVAHRRRDRGGFLKFLEKHRESMEILPKDSGTGGADLIDQALAEPGVFYGRGGPRFDQLYVANGRNIATSDGSG